MNSSVTSVKLEPLKTFHLTFLGEPPACHSLNGKVRKCVGPTTVVCKFTCTLRKYQFVHCRTVESSKYFHYSWRWSSHHMLPKLPKSPCSLHPCELNSRIPPAWSSCNPSLTKLKRLCREEPPRPSPLPAVSASLYPFARGSSITTHRSPSSSFFVIIAHSGFRPDHRVFRVGSQARIPPLCIFFQYTSLGDWSANTATEVGLWCCTL